jgi:hypothetical protein
MRAMREWWTDDQALAYAILEQGRVCCAELLEREASATVARRLSGAHCGFGLAGYAASDHLLGGVRAAPHVLVEEAGPARFGAIEGPEHALLFAIHGAAALERCFATPWLTAQAETAHRAVRQAHVALTGIVGLAVAADRTLEATRLGRLDRAWQAEHLRPPSLRELAERRGGLTAAAV